MIGGATAAGALIVGYGLWPSGRIGRANLLAAKSDLVRQIPGRLVGRTTDVEVMEVVIELDGSSGSALLPGMRTDVFFRR